MPYVHCDKCHHEWECATNDKSDRTCGWCGGGSFILEDETPLAKMLNNISLIDVAIDLIEKNNLESNEVGKKIIKHGLKKKK